MKGYFEKTGSTFNDLSREATLWSFYFGVAIFLTFIVFRISELVYLGFLYLIGAFIVNLACLIALLVILVFPNYPEERGLTITSILLSLCNIPIAAILAFLGMVLSFEK